MTVVPLAAAYRRPAMFDRLYRSTDFCPDMSRGYVIKHLIAPGDVGAIVGHPGCGKSILAPFLCYAVAQGRSVFGVRTKPGRTLYCAAEDISGMRCRIEALRLKHDNADDFALVDITNLRDPAEAMDLRATVAAFKPTLLVIDTIGAAWAGMDENSAADMSMVVLLSRQIAATGPAVLLIHHIAKHGDGTPRGHSSLNGTLDVCVMLTAADSSNVVRGKLTKNRNGTTDRDLAFRIESAEIYVDEDGDVITAPRCVEVASVASAPQLSKAARAGLRVLRDLGGVDVSETAWRARCDDARVISAADNRESRARAIRRALAELIETRVVRASAGCMSVVVGAASHVDVSLAALL